MPYSIFSIPKEVYIPKAGSVAFEINQKLKSGNDITQTLITAEKEKNMISKEKFKQFLLSSENYSFCDSCYNK
jgi:hypothetical protein